LSGKALTDSELYKEWKKSVTAEYNDQIEALKESLSDQYAEEKQKVIEDYPIFMAIAEDIGYDATGKSTNNNELDFIGKKLKEFIDSIEFGQDFFLTPEYDSQIYLVYLSQLWGRLDPHFHKIEFKMIEQQIENGKWNTSKLKDLFNISRGGSPRPINNYLTEDDNGVNWLKIGDTKEVDKYIYKTRQKIKPEGAKFSRKVIEDDLILSNSMSFGKPFIMKITAYIHDGWLLFRSITNQASKDYLYIVLGTNLIYQLFKKQTIGGVVENLNIDLVKHIKVPIPPQEIQEKIVAKMDDAYAAKKQKELEAQQLLDSIDDYLLGELGIELPEPEENTIKNRIFMRNLREVSGDRFDAPAHQKELLLPSTSFPMEKLKNCVFINPLTLFKGTKKDMQATFIPMENVSAIYGEADTSQVGNIEESNGYTRFLENDLIWAKITPCMQNGKSAVVSNLVNGIGFGSTEFHVFRAKTDIDIKYIYALLRLKILRNYAILYFSGSVGHQRVSDEFFKKLLIPLPPLEKQIEISEHITAIRNQAKQLQQQAKDDLEKAKQEVEAMILGDD
jgi:restriction endonuclease S subunit